MSSLEFWFHFLFFDCSWRWDSRLVGDIRRGTARGTLNFLRKMKTQVYNLSFYLSLSPIVTNQNEFTRVCYYRTQTQVESQVSSLQFVTVEDKLKWKLKLFTWVFIFLKKWIVPRAVPLLLSPTNLESHLKEH